jgi:hypothetical protein
MPLTARLRDEENERINNILKRLMGLDYVPENGNELINEMLSDIGLNMQTLLELSPTELTNHIEKSHFDWANAEQFADYLLKLGSILPESKFRLAEKVIAIYQHIQTQSKTFSIEIYSKINSIQKQIK